MKRLRRSHVLALFGMSAVGAVALPLAALAGPGAQAPNLRADPVGNIVGPGVYSGTEGGLGDNRLLVRFDGYVTNVGLGPLEVKGNPQIPGNVKQLARTMPGQAPSVVVGSPEVRYEAADSHNHWHLMRAMRYSLWNLEKTAQVAPSQKVGFCLYDIEEASGAVTTDLKTYTAAVTRFCENVGFGGGGAAATSLRMGTSPGWRDVYDQGLAYQWVDVSNTTPGTYLVGSEADPDNVIWEGGGAGENNVAAFNSQQVTIPGWVARPVALTQTGAAQTVPISSQQFGSESTANRRYRILSAPSRGTLNVPVNGTFSSAQPLTYTPSAGYLGGDSFTYAAFSTSSSFPTSPPAATVTVAGLNRTVTISGAPSTLVGGTSAQLTAALVNLPGGVTWTATAGSISATGLYAAPTTPPAGEIVVIRATSASDPSVIGEVGVKITSPPRITARPGGGGGPLSAGSKLVSVLRITNPVAGVVVAKVATGSKAGKVAITTTIGKKVLGRCAIGRIGARKTFTCKVTLKRPYPLKKVRVTAKFTTVGGKVAIRSSFVKR